MTNLEPGYYWIAIRRTDGTLAAPELAELIEEQNLWYLIGDWRNYRNDELVVLSERLSAPDAVAVAANLYLASNGDS